MRRQTIDASLEHKWTVVALHGFNSNGDEFARKLHPVWPSWWHDHARYVFLTAPLRRISCYNQTWYRSWHDYFTAFGDDGIEREEVIDRQHLEQMRLSIGMVVRQEQAKVGNVLLIGESQGACCALDVASVTNIPVIALFGQRYKDTPRVLLRHAWIIAGGRDTVISPKLIEDSLKDSGAHIRLLSSYQHAQSGRAVTHQVVAALRLISQEWVASSATHRPASPTTRLSMPA